MSHASLVRIIGVGLVALVTSAHIGSPDVFFTGKAGAYDIRVTIQRPEVVPGVARVTVRAPAEVQRVSIRPVFWRAGSKGAPSADETRRLEGQSGQGGGTFQGSLWLMQRGAYTVDVIVNGPKGEGNVLVPVASVATGRLAMNPVLGAGLAVFGLVLVAGLVNIVYKAAGESLVGSSEVIDAARLRRARRVAAVTVPILGLAIFGGARWWGDVDREYQENIYMPTALNLELRADSLQLEASDPMWLPSGKVARLIPDHGKLMHLFLVRSSDAGAFAHLHPFATDTAPNPGFLTRVPPLPAGRYHVYGDVVHETGFERTLVGWLTVPERGSSPRPESRELKSDPDDAWFVGGASEARTTSLQDGSVMQLDVVPSAPLRAREEQTLRISVRDGAGKPASLEPYLGMSAHAVMMRLDGSVYVHLHPMGTVTMAAQEAFQARDRGDTTAAGRLQSASAHETHAPTRRGPLVRPDSATGTIEFPYAFPKGGSYRLFVQVRRNGRVLTGAFALTVADAANASR